MNLSRRFLIILIMLCIAATGSNANQDTPHALSDGTLHKKIVDSALRAIGNKDSDIYKQVFNYKESPLSSACVNSFMKLHNTTNKSHLKTFTQMLDAWGKVPAGLLMGNSLWLGSYHECMDITNAQYCLNKIGPIKHGSCFPKSCSKNDVHTIFHFIGDKALDISNASVSVELLACDDGTWNWKLTTGAIISLAVMGMILFLCIIGTCVEAVFSKKKKSKSTSKPGVSTIIVNNKTLEILVSSACESVTATPVCTPAINKRILAPALNTTLPAEEVKESNTCISILKSFSLLKNCRQICSMDSPKGAITSVNGIRVISMTWVILGHYYGNILFGFGYGSTTDNVYYAYKVLHRFTALPITNAYVAVDSFFLLSGLLMSFITLRKIGRGTGSGLTLGEVLMMYVHRYIRLTPSLIIAVLFYTNLLPFTYAGPRSAYVREKALESNECYQYWWTNLLYINNFYPGLLTKGCLVHTWYLANDMQFYILAPGILFLMLFVQKKTSGMKSIRNVLALIGAMCFVSMFITGLLTGLFNIPTLMTAAGFQGNPRVKQKDMDSEWLYLKPYSRIPPYLVGMFLGYLLSRNDSLLQRKNSRLISITGWICASVLALLVVYGPWKVFKEPHCVFFSDVENIMYAACHRFIWSCAVGWVIFACHNNHGGLVNDFLSWKGWIPLGKLTYSTYLVHLMVFGGDGYFMVSREKPFHFQDSFAISEFISNVILSYAVAFVLTVTVEYPVLNLEKIVFKR